MTGSFDSEDQPIVYSDSSIRATYSFALILFSLLLCIYPLYTVCSTYSEIDIQNSNIIMGGFITKYESYSSQFSILENVFFF